MEIVEQIAGFLLLTLLTPVMLVMGIFVTIVGTVDGFVRYVFRKHM